jgi:hypothetical protein
LLEQLPGLKKTFFEWYKEHQASGNLGGASNARALGLYLQTVMERLDRPIFFIIDALDECSSASRKAVFDILKQLTDKATRLKILSLRDQNGRS